MTSSFLSIQSQDVGPAGTAHRPWPPIRTGSRRVFSVIAVLGVFQLASCSPDAPRMGEEPADSSSATQTGAPPTSAAGDPPEQEIAATPEQSVAFGAQVFFENCASCHQGGGEGIAGEVPPLADSDFLNEDKARAIDVVANGLDGEVVVNGHEFAERMPSLGLSDQDVANVLTYVFSQWGNSRQVVLPEEVARARR